MRISPGYAIAGVLGLVGLVCLSVRTKSNTTVPLTNNNAEEERGLLFGWGTKTSEDKPQYNGQRGGEYCYNVNVGNGILCCDGSYHMLDGPRYNRDGFPKGATCYLENKDFTCKDLHQAVFMGDGAITMPHHMIGKKVFPTIVSAGGFSIKGDPSKGRFSSPHDYTIQSTSQNGLRTALTGDATALPEKSFLVSAWDERQEPSDHEIEWAGPSTTGLAGEAFDTPAVIMKGGSGAMIYLDDSDGVLHGVGYRTPLDPDTDTNAKTESVEFCYDYTPVLGSGSVFRDGGDDTVKYPSHPKSGEAEEKTNAPTEETNKAHWRDGGEETVKNSKSGEAQDKTDKTDNATTEPPTTPQSDWASSTWSDAQPKSGQGEDKTDTTIEPTRDYEADFGPKSGEGEEKAVMSEFSNIPQDFSDAMPKSGDEEDKTDTTIEPTRDYEADFGPKSGEGEEKAVMLDFVPKKDWGAMPKSGDEESGTKTKVESSPGMKGDPHIKKWNGESYDFHGGCDLVMLHNPDFNNGQGLSIHVRTKIEDWWSYIETVVIKIGTDTLEIKGGVDDRRYWVNGKEGPRFRASRNLPFTIGGFHGRFRAINKILTQFKLYLPNGQNIGIKSAKDMIRVDMENSSLEDFGTSEGLMGTFGDGLMLGRDKKTRIEDPTLFGMEWQVRSTEPQLFHEMQGPQHPQKCALPTTTSTLRRGQRLQAQAHRMLIGMISREDAETACAIALKEEFNDCVYDVMATNDAEMVGAYA